MSALDRARLVDIATEARERHLYRIGVRCSCGAVIASPRQDNHAAHLDGAVLDALLAALADDAEAQGAAYYRRQLWTDRDLPVPYADRLLSLRTEEGP